MQIPILKRLAIVGYAKRTDWTPDEKIGWLLEKELLYRFKTDVFAFLKQTFPFATDAIRKSLIETALLGLPADMYASLEESRKD